MPRQSLDELALDVGKKARLRRILFQHGLANGTAPFLPYDQGLEHGPRDFFANPPSSDPRYIMKLAIEGGFNGVALQIGPAEKFFWEYAGEIPRTQTERQDRHTARRRSSLDRARNGGGSCPARR